MFKRVKNYILKNYLLNVVTELEAFGTERKLWRTNADICLVLTQLLLANESLIENIRVNEFATQTVISPYVNLSELETYVNDFLTQSQPFINGESSNRPKIVTSVGESNREIEFINFIEFHETDLFNALVRIKVLSERVKSNLKNANDARRGYLEDMLVPIFSILIGLVEQVYGAL